MADPAPDQLPPEFHQQPLTARMLEDFASCPRKFLLSFLATGDEARRLRGGSLALHQAVRQALLDMHQLGGPPRQSLDDLLAGFERHWEGRLCADSLEEQQLHRAGREMLRAYHEAHVGDEPQGTATDVRLAGAIGGQEFVAVADLVRTAGERVTVTRFLTSRHPLSAAELRTDLSATLLWLLATECYGVAGAQDVEVICYALREGRGRAVSLDADEAARLRGDLTTRVGRLRREEDFAPRKGPYCRWCRSRGRCPLWRR